MKEIWLKLNRKQRITVIACAAAIILILAVQMVLMPFLNGREKMKRSIAASETTLKEMISLGAEYSYMRDNISAIRTAIGGRPADFTLFSFIEKKAGEAGVRGNMKSLQPSKPLQAGPMEEISADIRLEKVTLKQVVDFVKAAESPQQAVVLKKLVISKNSGNPEYLSAQIGISAYQMSASEADSMPAKRGSYGADGKKANRL